MYPATRAAKANPDSNLRKWFVIALTEFQGFTYFISRISDDDLRGFWCRRKCIYVPWFYLLSELFDYLSYPQDKVSSILQSDVLIYMDSRCSVSVHSLRQFSHLPVSSGVWAVAHWSGLPTPAELSSIIAPSWRDRTQARETIDPAGSAKNRFLFHPGCRDYSARRCWQYWFGAYEHIGMKRMLTAICFPCLSRLRKRYPLYLYFFFPPVPSLLASFHSALYPRQGATLSS